MTIITLRDAKGEARSRVAARRESRGSIADRRTEAKKIKQFLVFKCAFFNALIHTSTGRLVVHHRPTKTGEKTENAIPRQAESQEERKSATKGKNNCGIQTGVRALRPPPGKHTEMVGWSFV